MTEKNIDGEDPIMGDHRVCRGCAGSGLAHDLSARRMQIVQQAMEVPAWTDENGRHKTRVIPGPGMISPRNPGTGSVRITDTRWSLHDCLYTAKVLASMGAKVPDLPYTEDDACDWCHGSGKPSLSVATLEIAARDRETLTPCATRR